MSGSIEERPWRFRAQTAPSLPGARAVWLDVLTQMLRALAAASPEDRAVIVDGAEFSLAEVSKLLGPGLTERRGGRLRPTPEAEVWAAEPDPVQLVRILHARVRLIGELLDLLRDTPLSHEDLRVRANEQYQMNWEKLDQLRRRTGWIRLAGLLEMYEGTVRLTDSGREFLSTVTLDGPAEAESGADVHLPEAQPAMSQALAALGTAGHGGRVSGGSLFLPAPDSGSISVARELVTLASEPLGESDLDEALAGYGIAQASARQARGTLRALGLIHRVSQTTWQSTRVALEWLATGESADFIRAAHAHVQFFGEILALMQDGPRVTADLVKASGSPSRNPLTTGAVRARLQLLREAGAVEKLSQKEFRLTGLGHALVKELPLEEQVSGIDVPERSVAADAAADAPDAEILADELSESSRDGQHPDRFEYAVRDALRFLGWQAERLGGAGKTDVRAEKVTPDGRHVVAFDAKSSGDFSVAESQVNLEALREHRASAGASSSVIVGNDFHRRTHTAAENDGEVAIVKLKALVDAVREHARRGLSWSDQIALFDPSRSSADREAFWVDVEGHRRRQTEILLAVLGQLAEEAGSTEPMYEGASLSPVELRRDLRQFGASAAEIESALALLAAPQIGAIVESGGRYRLTMDRDAVARRFRSWDLELRPS